MKKMLYKVNWGEGFIHEIEITHTEQPELQVKFLKEAIYNEFGIDLNKPPMMLHYYPIGLVE